MKHAFHSPAPDLGDPDIIYGTDWNDIHVVGCRVLAVDDALDTTDDFVEATGGVSGITITLPPCAGLGGAKCRKFKVLKADSGVGAVTLSGTINGDSSYILSNQFQYVEVQVRFDESGYLVVDNN